MIPTGHLFEERDWTAKETKDNRALAKRMREAPGSGAYHREMSDRLNKKAYSSHDSRFNKMLKNRGGDSIMKSKEYERSNKKMYAQVQGSLNLGTKSIEHNADARRKAANRPLHKKAADKVKSIFRR